MNWKLYISITLGFIIATIVGTLSHESAHYFAAVVMGCSPELHFDRVTNHCGRLISARDILIIIGAGPVQTILTGLIGFVLLAKSTIESRLNWRQWLLVLLALFPLRQLFNLVFQGLRFWKTGNIGYRSDEARLDEVLNLHNGSISLILGGVSIVIVYRVIFKYVPKGERITFIFAGFSGGILGYLFWLKYFGKLILP